MTPNETLISINFITGKFHGTPWGRHVNEGIPEVPPSPFRIIRAIIDSWKRGKVDVNSSHVETILEVLSSKPPVYAIPPYTKASTRAYLTLKSRNNFSGIANNSTSSLVFDNFILFSKDQSCIYMKWDRELTIDQSNTLCKLLEGINYLGRSESWVEMRVERSEPPNIYWNSYPFSQNIDHIVNKVNLALPISKHLYNNAMNWIDALCMQTEDIQTKGLSDSYGINYLTYIVPRESNVGQPYISHKNLTHNINFIEYGLESNVLPLITDSISVADRFHIYLNGRYRKMNGGANSERLSGRDKNGEILKDHKHIFIIPMDSDDDGLIDRIIIKSNSVFDENELKALYGVRKLYSKDSEEGLTLVIRRIGDYNQIIGEDGKISQKSFMSATPFITKRHYRKGRGDYDDWIKKELMRELAHHNLPIPSKVELIDREEFAPHNFRWYDFKKSRKSEEPMRGFGFKILFDESIDGFFTVGHGCHYGMGLFKPVQGGEEE
jgi:CRISPR-associated protein Csb2